jgi:hypothetical protein
MATTTITNNARRDFLNGDIDFGADTFKIALYNGSSHGVNTGAYTTVNEASGTGYSAGGVTLATVAISTDTSNNVAFVDWSTDPSWATSTITATDCMIYDDTVTTPTANVAVYIGDFNGSKSSSAGTFQVILPAAAASTAIIRLA